MTISFSVRAFLLDEQGQDIIEYALILVFLALGAVFSMKSLANSFATFFGALGNTLTNSV